MGNRTTGPELADTYIYDTDNRLLSASFDEYSGVDESWTYGYDYENRLTSVVKLSGDDTLTTTYKYDPFGRRIEKHVEGAVGGVSVNKTFTYVYDNEDVILEYLTGTEGGNPVERTTRYVHGLGIDEPLSMDRGGVVYYYHADGLGSIVALTDATEAVEESYAYTPFGGVESTGNVENTYTYTGREWDEEAGLYYYRARYYDPEVGRFIGKDPIGFAGGDVNLYNYVGGNAVNRKDPSGLEWIYETTTKTIFQVSANGDVVNSWPATTGPWGNGPLPSGSYTLPSPPVTVPPSHPKRSSYCDGTGNCWWQPITPNFPTSRDGLGIHPDGNAPGTAGCIGATDSDTSSLRDALMQDRGPLTVR